MLSVVFIGFWLAGPGPVRVNRAALERHSYMVSDGFDGFHWFLVGWPRPGPIDRATWGTYSLGYLFQDFRVSPATLGYLTPGVPNPWGT